MTDNSILEIASQRYEQEVSYSQFLDQKASNQVGFGGLIAGIMGTMFGYGVFSNDARAIHLDIHFLMLGLILLLVSIAIGILALTPFVKTRKLFNIEEFYKEYKDKPDKQIETMLQIYFKLINKTMRINYHKAIILYVGSACMLAGIIFSFISMIQLFKLIG